MRRKPSIFSSTYREQVRRRRINIILIILIVISAVYFGGKYYINKNDIKVFENSKIVDLLRFIKDSPDSQEGTVKGKDNLSPNTDGGNVQTNPESEPPASEVEEKRDGKYDYTLSDGKVIEIEYTILGGTRELKGLKTDDSNIFYDISVDKQKIVFEDKGTQDIVVCDINGKFVKLTLKKYVSKTTGEVVEKERNQKRRPWYIWSQKPHFTMDGRVVYLTHLPYLPPNSGLYLWSVKVDGTGHRKIARVSNNIDAVSYEGYTEDGKLKVKDKAIVYHLDKGSYTLKK